MIAPIQQTEDPPRQPGMRRVHHLVAATFLKRQQRPSDNAPPVPAWKAWLFAAWVIVATAAYSAYMIGIL